LCQYDELEINNRYRLKNSKSLASVEKIASVLRFNFEIQGVTK